MRFGLNFFPSFRPQDSTTADYYQQCLRIAERADALGYSSIKTVEHSFYDYGGHSPKPRVFLSAGGGGAPGPPPLTRAGVPALFPPPPPPRAPPQPPHNSKRRPPPRLCPPFLPQGVG